MEIPPAETMSSGGGGITVLERPMPAAVRATEAAMARVDAVVDDAELKRRAEQRELAGLEEELASLATCDDAENAARKLYNDILEDKRRVLADFAKRENEAKADLWRQSEKANGPRTRREVVKARIAELVGTLRLR